MRRKLLNSPAACRIVSNYAQLAQQGLQTGSPAVDENQDWCHDLISYQLYQYNNIVFTSLPVRKSMCMHKQLQFQYVNTALNLWMKWVKWIVRNFSMNDTCNIWGQTAIERLAKIIRIRRYFKNTAAETMRVVSGLTSSLRARGVNDRSCCEELRRGKHTNERHY